MGGVTRAPSRTLKVAQIVSNQNGNGTTATDVTGLEVTFIASAKVLWVEARMYTVLNTAAGTPAVYITDASNNQVALWNETMTVGAASIADPRRRLAGLLTPGTSYTFKVRVQAPTGATFDVRANADGLPAALGGPAFLRVYEE